MKAAVAALNQEKALVGAFSVIVQPVVEPMYRFTALDVTLSTGQVYYLERACMTQLLAMGAAGREALQLMPAAVQEATKRTAVGDNNEILDEYAAKHFYSKWSKYRARGSDVFH